MALDFAEHKYFQKYIFTLNKLKNGITLFEEKKTHQLTLSFGPL
jgi:hypothetical protein